MRLKNIQKLPDLIRLFRALPNSGHIFLRREFDRYHRYLSRLAKAYRRIFLRRTRIVAVVGSLGKTTTRRTISAALNCPERYFSFSNYGSSLAANILRIHWNDHHAVIEAGVAGPGPMESYAKMLRPDIVVVTSIKSEHNRSFPTLHDTRAEKVKMVRSLSNRGIAILNGDDPNVRWMATQTNAQVITVGLNTDNDIRAEQIKSSSDGTTFTAIFPNGSFQIKTQFLGLHMVYPFLAALAVANIENVNIDLAVARLSEVASAESRMEMLRLPGDITLLDDSFKGTIESVHAAFDVLASIPASRKIVVFGGVEEPPYKQGDLNREIGRWLGKIADEVICLGTGMSGIRAGAVEAGLSRESVQLIRPDFKAVVSLLELKLRKGDIVLIKGKSTQRLRRVVLSILGHQVSCVVPYCKVKVRSCDVCPLLDAPAQLFHNHYISRYVRA
ncbi:Mur ligase family protein [Thiohalophilus sp.]|uniref:Mur ligase family protein n=1 Tax=Thiohalophilus sp. TaxID=3028392 RepID=UPI002ACD353E|nr:Mur ligase family protein [Thiohalophilus sp.]MDZ7661086.1 Mur ligase family protein [Thiohalophilus sp.]